MNAFNIRSVYHTFLPFVKPLRGARCGSDGERIEVEEYDPAEMDSELEFLWDFVRDVEIVDQSET